MKPDPSAFVSGYCLLALTSLWCHLHKMNSWSRENKTRVQSLIACWSLARPGARARAGCRDWQELVIVTPCPISAGIHLISRAASHDPRHIPGIPHTGL